ncbi:acetyltransferase [Flavobacterium jejuense]|uniref:Acetyltransferase n=1 Tax=Flavobacterium jejuense TaxID=1544455 RepID=A0ABX0ISS2_9FLAO|nr:acetyltransferase [Flavobacterium jejuense]NHN26155.1 acetyltransferase [Flavobacterium jejuense]
MENIVIIGVGGFGREVKVLIDQINQVENKYIILGFYDDAATMKETCNGLKYLGKIEMLNNVSEKTSVAIGIGDPKIKEKIISKLTNENLNFPTLIHPTALLGDDYIEIGKGTIICAGSILTCNIKIGSFVTLNLYCTVGHDTEIGNYSSFMPSVNISGEVLIGERVYVGTGAKIINQLSIGVNTVVGAGAVVSRSLPENCTAVGIPAKPIKYH